MPLLKTFLPLACCILMAAAQAHAQGSRRIDAVIVAERPGPERTAAEAGSYVLLDGGYIEEGDPVAGERSPTPAAVRQAVEQGLSSKGFTAASPEDASLLVTYHYGVIRPRSLTPRVTVRLHPQYRARLAVVTPYALLERVEDALVLRDRGMPAPELQRVELRDALQAATGGRYFIILSAYDLAELRRGNQAPLWRVKMSTQDTSSSMDRSIRSLAMESGRFIGQNMRRPEFDSASLQPEPSQMTASEPSNSALGEDIARAAQVLSRQEHEMFSGSGGSDADYDLWRARKNRR